MRVKVYNTVFIIFLLIASMWVGIFGFTNDASGQSVIIVPQDYATIQQAINNAGTEDTIQVWAGTYTENIIVFKSLSIIGNGTANTIIDGSYSGDVVRISANNVFIQGFTITGSGIVSTNAGIKLNSVQSCKISYNNISNNNYGVYLSSCSDITVNGNSFMNNNNHAYDSGTNTWNLSYPTGGNYWDDYNGSDSFSGPDQAIPSADGLVDLTYKNITGPGTAFDQYPLMLPLKPPVGSIIITSHQNGNYIKGTVIIDTVVTTYQPAGVNFFINDEFWFADSEYPFQFILDTTALPEDSTFQLTAEVVRYSPSIITTIELVVNNQIQTGDYLALSTISPLYHPDQEISVLVTTKSPPAFDTLNLMISYSTPSSYTHYAINKSLPYNTDYLIGVPLFSDSELGLYTLTISGFGYKNGVLIWSATKNTTFLVTGKNLHVQLETIQTRMGDIENNLTALNSTLLDNLTDLENNLLSQFNSTLTQSVQNLTTKITNEIILMNSSLSDQITAEHQTLRTWLELVISELDSNLSLMDENFQTQLRDFENRTAENLSFIQTNVSLVLARLETFEVDISELKMLLNDTINSMSTMTLAELSNKISELSADVSEYNSTMAYELSDLNSGITNFLSYLTQKLADIDNTLDDLDKMDDILIDLRSLDEKLRNLQTDTGEDELKVEIEDSPQTNLQTFILIMILIILLFILYIIMITPKTDAKKPTRKKNEQKPPAKKEPPNKGQPPPGQKSVHSFFNPKK